MGWGRVLFGDLKLIQAWINFSNLNVGLDMKSILKSLLVMLFLSVGLGANAQTIVQDDGNGTLIAVAIGQSFTATVNGKITAISVRTPVATTATLQIYSGASGSGTAGALGTPAYTDPTPFNTTAAIGGFSNSAGGFSTFTLTTPFPVVAGNSYTFILTTGGTINLALRTGNPYGAGNLVANYAVAVPGSDLAFQVFEAQDPPAPIPTLSEWALMVLSVLVAAITAFKLRRSTIRS